MLVNQTLVCAEFVYRSGFEKLLSNARISPNDKHAWVGIEGEA
jgi:hypothetical protein